MKQFLLLAFYLTLATVGRAQVEIPAGVSVARDVVYIIVDEDTLLLDVYYHKEIDKPEPLVIWIHGGGWRKGSKDRPRAAVELLGHGFAVASINYRLSDRALFPAQIMDCKAAVRWLKHRSDKFNIDSGRVGVWGASAGGHLSALVGTSWHVKKWDAIGDNQDVSSGVQAVCDWYGPTDFLKMDDRPGKFVHNDPDSPEGRLIGGPIQENKRKTKSANPITYIKKGSPPFLIMHGKLDELVLWEQSQLLYDALISKGQEAELILFNELKHGGQGWHEELDHVIEFFKSKLK